MNRQQITLHAQLEDTSSRPFELLNRALRRDLPLVHHDDVVAGVLDVGQQMRREDQVDVLVVAEIADELEHLVAPLGIHPVRRLVEKQQIGIVDERLRQLDSLLHARRIRLDVAVTRLAEADVVEHLVGTLHRVDGGQPGKLTAIAHERYRVHAGNVRVALGHVADVGTNLHRPFGDVEAQHGHASFVRLHEAEQSLQHGALASAVRAQKADRAAREPRSDVLERLVLAVDDRDAIELDDRIRLGFWIQVLS